MAENEAQEREGEEGGEVAQKGISTKTLIIIAAALALLVFGLAGFLIFAGGDEETPVEMAAEETSVNTDDLAPNMVSAQQESEGMPATTTEGQSIAPPVVVGGNSPAASMAAGSVTAALPAAADSIQLQNELIDVREKNLALQEEMLALKQRLNELEADKEKMKKEIMTLKAAGLAVDKAINSSAQTDTVNQKEADKMVSERYNDYPSGFTSYDYPPIRQSEPVPVPDPAWGDE